MKRLILDQLLDWKKSTPRKPLILKGARQVGKTYVLKEFGQNHFKAFHYFNFEKEFRLRSIFEQNLDPHRIIQDLAFASNASIDQANDLIIFDEIQNCPKAITALKYFQEEIPNLAICAAGSLLGLELSNESFPVGKVSLLEMYPMSFEEFLMAVGSTQEIRSYQDHQLDEPLSPIKHQRFLNWLKIYFVVGGLPEMVSTYMLEKDTKVFSIVRQKQEQLITMYTADMAKHCGKQNAMEIERLFRNIPTQLSKNMDGQSSRFRFKNIVEGKNQYQRLKGIIDWLEATGLVIKIFICRLGAKPRMAYASENMFKLFIMDAGLLGALSDLSPNTLIQSDYGTFKGYFVENFVAQELKALGQRQLFSWTEGQSEIEFLMDINGNLIPFEVKSGRSLRSKSLSVFNQKYKPLWQVVLSAKEPHIQNNKINCPLYFIPKLLKYL